ncbi:hypothetical protein GCM10010400_17550 [Streptomyces aculeolatus]|uniref:DNA cytosine methyltransferase n=1 Tax=Streptomyces aculeolatus TaxID=270689 RepID=UPI001CEC88EE|nr:DNA cytosine methyltransferase [Streptomyces aculeolatus]
MHDGQIVDLFAGPGGLDVAASWLDVPAIGVELDASACATRDAAGLATKQGDVSSFGPADFPDATILAGGPPCQTYAVAGAGAGRRALAKVLDLAELMVKGEDEQVEAKLARLAKTPGDNGRTGLVLQPLRWALEAVKADRPYDVIVLEQVTTVLPVWQAFGRILRRVGYSAVTKVLHAEEYGVPQTRRRAVLIARLQKDGRGATLPIETHRPFRKRLTVEETHRQEWVAMGDVLSREQPFEVVSNYGTGGDPKVRGKRRHDEPAFTVTGKISRNRVGPPGLPDSRFTNSEAGQLQSFPADYPWRGRDVSQQIGNAIPPVLAVHVLAAALKLGDEARDAAVEKAITVRAAAPEALPSVERRTTGSTVQGALAI